MSAASAETLSRGERVAASEPDQRATLSQGVLGYEPLRKGGAGVSGWRTCGQADGQAPAGHLKAQIIQAEHWTCFGKVESSR